MGTHYGRLVSFVFAVCCCLAVVSIVNIAFATTRTEAMYGTMSGGKVAYKSAAQMRLDKMHTYSFQQVPDQVARYVPKNKTFTPSYTSAQLAGMVKNVGKNTLGWAAVAGAIAAAGWAIDELTGQVTKTTQVEQPSGLHDPELFEAGYGWRKSSNPLSPTPSTAGCYGSVYPSCYGEFSRHSETSGRVYLFRVDGTNPRRSMGSTMVYRDPTNQFDTLPTETVDITTSVSDAEFNDQVLPKFLGLPNSQIESAINSLPQTPQLSDMLRDWLQEVADRSPNLTFDPTTKTLTYTDPDTGETTELETQPPSYTQDGTESFTDVPGTDWPAACEWFPKLCEWLDWTQEFEEPQAQEMPFEEINLADIQEDFDSGLGSGSCPAPVSVSHGGQSIQYSFDTACFAAETYFKPILLTMAAIMAGFIIVGATRKGV